MNLINSRILIVSIVVFVIFALFLAFVDASASTSNTGVDQKISGYSFSQPNSSDPAPTGVVYLDLKGENGFSVILEDEVADLLEKKGFKVETISMEPVIYDSTALAVVVNEPDIFYNPFYSTATMDVDFVYSHTGNMEYLDMLIGDFDKPVVFSSMDGYQLLRHGKLTFNDTTKGLVTYPYYRRHLAENIAAGVVEKAFSDDL
jgi:hypothetical protein